MSEEPSRSDPDESESLLEPDSELNTYVPPSAEDIDTTYGPAELAAGFPSGIPG